MSSLTLIGFPVFLAKSLTAPRAAGLLLPL